MNEKISVRDLSKYINQITNKTGDISCEISNVMKSVLKRYERLNVEKE